MQQRIIRTFKTFHRDISVLTMPRGAVIINVKLDNRNLDVTAHFQLESQLLPEEVAIYSFRDGDAFISDGVVYVGESCGYYFFREISEGVEKSELLQVSGREEETSEGHTGEDSQ